MPTNRLIPYVPFHNTYLLSQNMNVANARMGLIGTGLWRLFDTTLAKTILPDKFTLFFLTHSTICIE